MGISIKLCYTLSTNWEKMQYFPSKKVIVVAVFALGISAWVIFKNDSVSYLEKNLQAPFGTAEASTAFPDSDLDGLSDWYENLLGTNSADPDSDNNGISDGVQYASLKNIPTPLPTDNVLNYISQLGNASQNNGVLPQVPEVELVIPEDHYTLHDLVLVDTSTTTIISYVTGVLGAFDTYPDPSSEEVLESVSRWLEEKDPHDLELVNAYSAHNISLSAELAELEIPHTLAETHLALINSLYLSGSELEKVILVTQSPMDGFFAAANYANFRSKRSQTLVTLTQFYFEYMHDYLSQENV